MTRSIQALILLACTLPLASQAVLLYDASLGTFPGTQGWIGVIDTSTIQTHNGSATRLDSTTDRADQSGFFSEDPAFGLFQHPALPVMDRSAGYTIRFNLQVLSEGHDIRDDNGDLLNDRAGFSMIAISEDLLGLELAFFEDRVWAYAAAGEGPNSLFTQAEGAAFDTTAGMVQFDFSVLNNGYSLNANGVPLLAGNLRNYNPSGLSSFVDPYNNPSFLFFGDDTTSADADVLLGDIEINPPPDLAVPEARTALPLLILGLSGLLRRKRA